MTNKTDTITGIFVMAFSIFGYWGTTFTSNVAGTTDPVGPVAFARWVTYFLFFCGVMQTVVGLRDKHSPKYWPDSSIRKKVWIFMALICGYTAMAAWVGDIMDWLNLNDLPSGYGLTAASFVYLVVTLYACGRRKPLEIILVSFLMPAIVCYIFAEFFQIVLP